MLDDVSHHLCLCGNVSEPRTTQNYRNNHLWRKPKVRWILMIPAPLTIEIVLCAKNCQGNFHVCQKWGRGEEDSWPDGSKRRGSAPDGVEARRRCGPMTEEWPNKIEVRRRHGLAALRRVGSAKTFGIKVRMVVGQGFDWLCWVRWFGTLGAGVKKNRWRKFKGKARQPFLQMYF